VQDIRTFAELANKLMNIVILTNSVPLNILVSENNILSLVAAIICSKLCRTIFLIESFKLLQYRLRLKVV